MEGTCRLPALDFVILTSCYSSLQFFQVLGRRLSESEHDAATEAKRIPMGAYVDRDQHRRLAELAERNERSLSAEMRLAQREHIERDELS